MQFEAILSDLNFQSPKTTKQNMTKVKKLKARLLKLKNLIFNGNKIKKA